jgi:hypothetical protein
MNSESSWIAALRARGCTGQCDPHRIAAEPPFVSVSRREISRTPRAPSIMISA